MMKRFLSFTFPVEIKFTNEQLLVRRFKAINYSENILKIFWKSGFLECGAALYKLWSDQKISVRNWNHSNVPFKVTWSNPHYFPRRKWKWAGTLAIKENDDTTSTSGRIWQQVQKLQFPGFVFHQGVCVFSGSTTPKLLIRWK